MEQDALAGSRSIVPTPIIAGIGASAGGIEALQSFFEALPENVGVAFVVVLHLSPEHRSMLPAIIAARTTMPVEQVTGTVRVQANRVYVVPPDRRLQIANGMIAAIPFDEPRGRRAPIDFFFRSLAEEHGDGFGIILSGGGSDGAVGVKAIKEGGGLVLVQDPAEAKHDSMPRAAIATHVADIVLPVRGLASRLAELAHTKRRVRNALEPNAPGLLDADAEGVVGRILTHLHASTGHDFKRYKRKTVLRRFARRMTVQRNETLGDYYAFLRRHVDESRALFADLLISVTTFFRDPEAWQALAYHVIPRLFDERAPSSRIRVWVPGCATGEEAYSLAMLFLEEADRRQVRADVKIFASDLDDVGLASARQGRYPKSICADVSDERLRRFFREKGEEYSVTREVRDCVVFTKHDLMRDPPFSRLDLVCCRNVVIHLEQPVRQQIFGLFRYALGPERFLFVGAAESADGRDFRALDDEQHIYQARKPVGRDALHLPELVLAMPRGLRPRGA